MWPVSTSSSSRHQAIVWASAHPRARSASRPSSADQPVEPVPDVARRVPELGRPHDGGDARTRARRQRHRVDHQPGLALGGQHVVAVQVLVDQHLLALRRRAASAAARRSRPAAAGRSRGPSAPSRPPACSSQQVRLVLQRAERGPAGSGTQVRGSRPTRTSSATLAAGGGQRVAGLAALEQHAGPSAVGASSRTAPRPSSSCQRACSAGPPPGAASTTLRAAGSPSGVQARNTRPPQPRGYGSPEPQPPLRRQPVGPGQQLVVPDGRVHPPEPRLAIMVEHLGHDVPPARPLRPHGQHGRGGLQRLRRAHRRGADPGGGGRRDRGRHHAVRHRRHLRPRRASEELLGRALGSRRGDVVVATKFGMDMQGDNGPDWGARGSRRYIRKAVEASLRRLGTDWIDLYQLHEPDPVTPIERDAGRAARAGAGGQGPQHRLLELRRLAGGGRRLDGPHGRLRALHQRPEQVLAAGPGRRGRAGAGLRARSGWASCRSSRWSTGCSPASTGAARPRRTGRGCSSRQRGWRPPTGTRSRPSRGSPASAG